jgi:hypothetical protein
VPSFLLAQLLLTVVCAPQHGASAGKPESSSSKRDSHELPAGYRGPSGIRSPPSSSPLAAATPGGLPAGYRPPSAASRGQGRQPPPPPPSLSSRRGRGRARLGQGRGSKAAVHVDAPSVLGAKDPKNMWQRVRVPPPRRCCSPSLY